MSKIVTIDSDCRGHIVARNECGIVVGRRNPYCNPAALCQLILDVEMEGFVIDWQSSQVAEPEDLS